MKYIAISIFGIAAVACIGFCAWVTKVPECILAVIPVSAFVCLTFFNI